MEKIIVTIDPLTGALEYAVSGVKGKGCKALTKHIDDLGKVIETKTTSEYNQVEVAPKTNIKL